MTRSRLPHRRAHESVSFDHGGFAYVAGIGRFTDGRLAEIFLNSAKSGTAVDAWARDAAVLASLALQHDVPAETIQRAVTRDEAGNAAGPVGHLLDLLAEEKTSGGVA
jgi:ribonucleoside-diphosphate reductase alpha chain